VLLFAWYEKRKFDAQNTKQKNQDVPSIWNLGMTVRELVIKVTLFNSTVSTILKKQFQLAALKGGKET